MVSPKLFQRQGHIIDQHAIQDTIHRHKYTHELQAHDVDLLEWEADAYNT